MQLSPKVQGASGFLNSAYNLVHKQKSQFMIDMILLIEENLEDAPPRNTDIMRQPSRETKSSHKS